MKQDDLSPEWVVFFFMLPIVLTLGYFFFHRIGVLGKVKLTPLSGMLKRQMPELLNRYSSYYRKLPLKYRPEFEKRVKQFIQLKKFEARNISITDEIKVTLAAYAVQLSFGYKELVSFEHFHTILVYPKPYLSTITKKEHKGEVNGRGYIVLSWRDVVRGGADETDGVNLALHEFAHALHLENDIQNESYNFLSEYDLNVLWSLAEFEKEDIKDNNNSFLRAYASSNKNEFFAVCIENFFERPKELQQTHPTIYTKLVRLLKQDPDLLFK